LPTHPICAHLVLMLAIGLVGCRESILHDLSEPEANKVTSRLHAQQVQAVKVAQSDGRWAIEVPTRELVKALEFLDSHRVLAGRASVANASGKGGFVPSREEQWFRYERSVATSIEESLGAIQGVLEAKVHVNLPEVDPLFGTRRDDRGSGSVLLLVDDRFGPKSDEIAALVGGASGIPPNTITVLVSTARLEASPVDEPLTGASIGAPEHDGNGERGLSQLGSRGFYIGGIAVISVAALCGLIKRIRNNWGQPVKFTLPEGVAIEG